MWRTDLDWLLNAANWFGSAVCHQWDSHSYIIAGTPLCLCARCTGMYLGGLLTLACLALRKPRAARLPTVPYLIALFVFFLLWAGDGLNSVMSELLRRPFMYEPQNLLRMVTGTLMGIALGSLLYLMLNTNLYRAPETKPIYENPLEFLLLLALGGVLVVVVNSQAEILLYPLSALMLIAILALNAALWTAFVASFGRAVTQPNQLWRRAALGLVCALVLLDALAIGRVLLGIATDVPL